MLHEKTVLQRIQPADQSLLSQRIYVLSKQRRRKKDGNKGKIDAIHSGLGMLGMLKFGFLLVDLPDLLVTNY